MLRKHAMMMRALVLLASLAAALASADLIGPNGPPHP
jgi:hypothetical protein